MPLKTTRGFFDSDEKMVQSVNIFNKEYACYWCKNKFKRRVVHEEIYDKGKKTYTITSQVKCRKCGNFIKTFDD